MTININAGLAITMQSAIAAARTITAITRAAPGVISSTTHGYVNGDILLLRVAGMHELNLRVVRVIAAAADSFQIAGPDGTTGLDTSNYGTFTSGTAERLTMGTAIGGVADFSPSGGDAKFVDTTTVHDIADRQRVVGSNPLSYSMDLQWNPADPGQIALKAIAETFVSRAFRIRYPSGANLMLFGSVGFSGAPGGGRQGVATATAAIAADGLPTISAA